MRIILFVWIGITSLGVNGQLLFEQILFQNPSFEGNPGGSVTPNNWIACRINSTPDTQPGAFGVTISASDGKTFLGIITRDNGGYEAVGQALQKMLIKDLTYCFTVDLAYDDEKNYLFRLPNIVRIWGSDSDCNQNELLWSSPEINHREWQKYQICFSPHQNHSYLMIDTYYTGTSYYNGTISIDNLSEIEYIENTSVTICQDDSLLYDAYPENGGAGWNVKWKKNSVLFNDVNSDKLWLKKEGVYNLEISKGSRTYPVKLTVKSQECESNFFIPNLFTPNGDTWNESFSIRGIKPENWKLSLYNRWGKLVYQTESYDNSWKGEGENATYYYILSHRGSGRTYKGFVTVAH